eukprot:UN06598
MGYMDAFLFTISMSIITFIHVDGRNGDQCNLIEISKKANLLESMFCVLGPKCDVVQCGLNSSESSVLLSKNADLFLAYLDKFESYPLISLIIPYQNGLQLNWSKAEDEAPWPTFGVIGYLRSVNVDYDGTQYQEILALWSDKNDNNLEVDAFVLSGVLL